MSTHHIDLSDFERDPRLFLFTSLTAGSSHIITATSRLETILKANKIPFQAIDLATDEKARRLWQRRARERKLPGLVREGFVVGDLDEVEEWNEFGELKENIGPVPAGGGDTSAHRVATGVSTAPPIPVNPTATKGTANLSQPPVNKAPPPGVDESKFRALPGAAEMAERGKAQPASTSAPSQGAVSDENAPPPKGVETMASAPVEKQESVTAAKKLLRAVQGNGGRAEHLSAPPSGVATPEGEKADVAAAAKEEEKEQSTGAGEEEGKVEGESGVRDAAAEEVQGRSAGGEVEEAQRVGATDAGEGKVAEEVGAQSAKEGGDAGKSVGD